MISDICLSLASTLQKVGAILFASSPPWMINHF
jgi:hypothetical protein